MLTQGSIIHYHRNAGRLGFSRRRRVYHPVLHPDILNPHANDHAAPDEFRDFHDIGKWYGEKHLGHRWLYDLGLGAWLRYDGKVWTELEKHQLCLITDRISDTRWGLARS